VSLDLEDARGFRDRIFAAIEACRADLELTGRFVVVAETDAVGYGMVIVSDPDMDLVARIGLMSCAVTRMACPQFVAPE
jgi:hypothetical protein